MRVGGGVDSGQPQVAETAVGLVSGAVPGPKKLTSSRGSGGTTKLARKTLTLEASNRVASGMSGRPGENDGAVLSLCSLDSAR